MDRARASTQHGRKPIPEMAIKYRVPYHRIRLLLERGILEGGRGSDGRWFVEESSLVAYGQKQGKGQRVNNGR